MLSVLGSKNDAKNVGVWIPVSVWTLAKKTTNSASAAVFHYFFSAEYVRDVTDIRPDFRQFL